MTLCDAPAQVPGWMRPIVRAVGAAGDAWSGLAAPDGAQARDSAVLILFGETARRPDILLTERSHRLRSHPGEVAFPGGRVEAGDADVAATALREAAEETGVDPRGIDVVGALPPLWLEYSNHEVTPVLGW